MHAWQDRERHYPVAVIDEAADQERIALAEQVAPIGASSTQAVCIVVAVAGIPCQVAYGHPDFGVLQPCNCTQGVRRERQAAQLTKLRNLEAFRDKTFANFDARATGTATALRCAQDHATHHPGAGAEVDVLVAAIQERYPHTEVVPQPQTAIARGYARLARRLGKAN